MVITKTINIDIDAKIIILQYEIKVLVKVLGTPGI